jgi:hypothetical protein
MSSTDFLYDEPILGKPMVVDVRIIWSGVYIGPIWTKINNFIFILLWIQIWNLIKPIH